MQNPKPLIAPIATFLLGISLGLFASIYIFRPQTSGISSHELEVQRTIDLLADLSNGRQNFAKARLEVDLKFALKQINTIAREKGLSGDRARITQKVVSKWRTDNPNINLSPELLNEIQTASTQIP